jgi:uncharacterized protein (DUF2141 family)
VRWQAALQSRQCQIGNQHPASSRTLAPKRAPLAPRPIRLVANLTAALPGTTQCQPSDSAKDGNMFMHSVRRPAMVAVVAVVKMAAVAMAATMFAGTGTAAELTVEFSIKGAQDGMVYLSVYSSAADWMKKPARQVRAPVSNEAAVAVVPDLPPGEYAASAYHDRNGNGALDTNFFKVPSEPYGFSNGASGSFGPPAFDRARFSVESTSRKIALTLK